MLYPDLNDGMQSCIQSQYDKDHLCIYLKLLVKALVARRLYTCGYVPLHYTGKLNTMLNKVRYFKLHVFKTILYKMVLPFRTLIKYLLSSSFANTFLLLNSKSNHETILFVCTEQRYRGTHTHTQ